MNPQPHATIDTHIATRLWQAFGANPFKPNQLLEYFQDDDLIRVNNLLFELKERGHAILDETEGGDRVWRLVP